MITRGWRRTLAGLATLVVATSYVSNTSAAPEANVFMSEQQPATQPNHVRLAYRPARPTRLLDVPGTFWTVQLIVVSTKEALESYARAHQLGGMSAARIAHNGELFYALLLGVYETQEIAEQATRDLPAPLDELGVWIRSLASLQRAIIEANNLAGEAEF